MQATLMLVTSAVAGALCPAQRALMSRGNRREGDQIRRTRRDLGREGVDAVEAPDTLSPPWFASTTVPVIPDTVPPSEKLAGGQPIASRAPARSASRKRPIARLRPAKLSWAIQAPTRSPRGSTVVKRPLVCRTGRKPGELSAGGGHRGPVGRAAECPFHDGDPFAADRTGPAPIDPDRRAGAIGINRERLGCLVNPESASKRSLELELAGEIRPELRAGSSRVREIQLPAALEPKERPLLRAGVDLQTGGVVDEKGSALTKVQARLVIDAHRIVRGPEERQAHRAAGLQRPESSGIETAGGAHLVDALEREQSGTRRPLPPGDQLVQAVRRLSTDRYLGRLEEPGLPPVNGELEPFARRRDHHVGGDRQQARVAQSNVAPVRVAPTGRTGWSAVVASLEGNLGIAGEPLPPANRQLHHQSAQRRRHCHLGPAGGSAPDGDRYAFNHLLRRFQRRWNASLVDGGAGAAYAVRFPPPPFKPCMRISRTRLTGGDSRCSMHGFG